MPLLIHSARNLKRPGLTIVELLVAMALASMLLGTATELLKILAMKRKVLVDENTMVAWHHPLELQLRWDLANARRFEFTSESLRLTGYGARDFDTQVATHRRSEIVYKFVRVADKTWLLREEIQPDLPSNHNRRREIVCCGLTGIAMDIPGQVGDPQHTGSMPEQYRLRLTRDSDPQPVIDILCCR